MVKRLEPTCQSIPDISRKFFEIAGFSWVAMGSAPSLLLFCGSTVCPRRTLFEARSNRNPVFFMFSTGNQNQTRRWIDILCQRYGYGMIWIVLLFNVEYVLYCYTIILWNSTLSTILKHSKSRNKSLHAKMNQFSTICPPNVGFSSFISAAGCQRPWALLGRCWLGRWKRWRWGAGIFGAAGAVGWSLTVGEGTFLSREICHVIINVFEITWTLTPLKHFIMLEVFQNSKNEIKKQELLRGFLAKPLYTLDLHPTQDSSG